MLSDLTLLGITYSSLRNKNDYGVLTLLPDSSTPVSTNVLRTDEMGTGKGWILSHNSLLQIDEHLLAAQIFSFVAAPPEDLKELEHRCIVQIITPTDWHAEGPGGRATRVGLSHRTVLSRMKRCEITRAPTN